MYCNDCKHFKGDMENCIDNITIAFADIKLAVCDGYEEKKQ